VGWAAEDDARIVQLVGSVGDELIQQGGGGDAFLRCPFREAAPAVSLIRNDVLLAVVTFRYEARVVPRRSANELQTSRRTMRAEDANEGSGTGIEQ
jgi:hypothetical protein